MDDGGEYMNMDEMRGNDVLSADNLAYDGDSVGDPSYSVGDVSDVMLVPADDADDNVIADNYDGYNGNRYQITQQPKDSRVDVYDGGETVAGDYDGMNRYNQANTYTTMTTDFTTLPPYEDGTVIQPIERSTLKENNNDATDNSTVATATMFFSNDPDKRIDYVLAYEDLTDEQKNNRRIQFEANLKEAGLELEYQDKSKSADGKTNFIKVNCTWDSLLKGAQMMKMRKRLKIHKNAENEAFGEPCRCCCCCPQPSDEDSDYFTAPFDSSKMDIFEMHDRQTFFTNAERSLITKMILDWTEYESDRELEIGKKIHHIGIESLTHHGVYTAAYPLHEPLSKSDSNKESFEDGPDIDRERLFQTWAKFSNIVSCQPLDLVRKYFGEKIGIYFAWLGTYTIMLIPASVVGLAVFIYGVVTMFQDIPTLDVCGGNQNGLNNTWICPLCDILCTYEQLGSSCSYAKFSYIFDNDATVAMALFMSAWAICFLEVWKRKEKEIQYDWDVADFEADERMRPQYPLRVTDRKLNPVTQKLEPHVPGLSRFIRMFTTVSILFFLVLVVLGVLFGVLVYRVIVVTLMYEGTSSIGFLQSNSILIITITASIINLVFITLLSYVYQFIAKWLTNIELHRTQTQYEDAYTFKIIIFEFLNYYGSILYIAYFKGSFVNRPGDDSMYLFKRYRQDQCDPTGCFIELTIQLVIIFVGKQCASFLTELIVTKVKKCWSLRHDLKLAIHTRWEEDYHLEPYGSLGLFTEYQEAVIQYGFVTLFVAAFPLAPLFALITNMIEMRLAAYELVKDFRRPAPVKAQDIGAWFDILKAFTFIGIVTNGFIMAWTSNFVPRTVYMLYSSQNYTLTGYVNNSLSVFNTSDFLSNQIPQLNGTTLPQCRYHDYRYGPNYGEESYEYTTEYWLIFMARMAFVIVFEHICFLLAFLMMLLIPNTPGRVRRLRRYERELNEGRAFEANFTKGPELMNYLIGDPRRRSGASVSS